MISSDEFNLVLAISETGRLSQAAQKLALDHSTVYRKLAEIEQRIGAKLFLRVAGRYQPTRTGEMVLQYANRWRTEHLALSNAIQKERRDPNGVLRVTTTEDVAIALLPTCVKSLRSEFSELRVEVIVDDRLLDLSQQEADIAIRPTRTPPAGWVGSSLGRIEMAVYAARVSTTQRAASRAAANASLAWVALDEKASPSADRAWMDAHVEQRQIVATFSTFSAMLFAVQAGIGCALMPCFVGERNASLSRVEFARSDTLSPAKLWLLCDSQMRTDARIRAFFSVAKASMSGLRP
jgi:DNA-binding transcriptional LysR family regulator